MGGMDRMEMEPIYTPEWRVGQHGVRFHVNGEKHRRMVGPGFKPLTFRSQSL